MTDQQRPAQAPQFERKPRDVVISPCDGSAPRVSREGVRRGVRVVHDSRRVALVGRLGGSTRSRGVPIVVMGVFPEVLTIGLISFFG